MGIQKELNNSNFENWLFSNEDLVAHTKTRNKNLKEIKVSFFKSLIKRKTNIYKRRVKILWAIGIKNDQWIASNKTKFYSSSDILRLTNSCLEKDKMNKITDRTLRSDILYLNKIKLLKTHIQHLGKEKGSFAFYIQEKDFWKYRFEILRSSMIEDFDKYMEDKKIVGNFSVDQDELLSVDTQIATEQISAVFPLGKKDIVKIKNSRRIPFEKNFSEFKKQDLKLKFKVPDDTFGKIYNILKNEISFKNSLLNLESALNEFSREYKISDIIDFFIKELFEYKNKIWFMRKPKESLKTDYYDIWGRFKDITKNKFKEAVSKSYFNGFETFKVTDDGEFKKGLQKAKFKYFKENGREKL